MAPRASRGTSSEKIMWRLLQSCTILTGTCPLSCATTGVNPNHNMALATRIRCFTLAISCLGIRSLCCTWSGGKSFVLQLRGSMRRAWPARKIRHSSYRSGPGTRKLLELPPLTLRQLAALPVVGTLALRRLAIESALWLACADLAASERHGFKRALKPEFWLLVRLSRRFSFEFCFWRTNLDDVAHVNASSPQI